MSYKKQSRGGSLLESLIAALISAPTAITLTWYLFDVFGNNFTDSHLKSLYLVISWTIFLTHSFAWKYIWRRIFNRYGIEPSVIVAWIKKKVFILIH